MSGGGLSEPYDTPELDPDSDSDFDSDEIKIQHPITDCHGSKDRHLWRKTDATSLLVVLTRAIFEFMDGHSLEVYGKVGKNAIVEYRITEGHGAGEILG